MPGTVVITPFEPDLRENRTIRVWGYITAEGVGKLHLYEGKMDSEKYCDVLEKNLKEHMGKLIEGEMLFMQDNATCHNSKYSKANFFEKKGFQPIDWPPQSPDLNPIENLWSIMKEKLWRERAQIKNERDTWKMAQEIWYKKIPQEIVQKMYKRMSERCSKVVKQKGMRIKLR